MNHTTAQRLHPQQVTLADDVGALAAALAASSAVHRARVKRRLAPVDVLTPHRAMSEWLRAELTAIWGIVLHVRWLASPHALIFHGLDQRALLGTYLEVGAPGAARAVTDWDQGLLRLALGAFIGADRSGVSDDHHELFSS